MLKLVPSLTHSLIVGGLVHQLVSNVKEDVMCSSDCLSAYLLTPDWSSCCRWSRTERAGSGRRRAGLGEGVQCATDGVEMG